MSEELEKAYKEIQVQNVVSLERDILEKEELINELLTDFSFKFLYDDEGNYDPNRITILKQIMDLYGDTYKDYDMPKYKKVFKASASCHYAKEFLAELGPKYLDTLEKAEADNTVLYYTYRDVINYDLIGISHFYYQDGKNYIGILCDFNAGDIYSIIHETVHATNAYEKEMGMYEPEDMDDKSFYTWDLFTETMSYFATRLAHMYFKDKYPEDKELPKEYYEEEDGFNRVYYKTEFLLKLLDIYLEKGQVTSRDLVEILSGEDDDMVLRAYDQLVELYDREYFVIINNISYLLGNIVVKHILANNDYNSAKQIFYDMNQMVKEGNSVTDIFKYLDLDVEELDKWFVSVKTKELNKLGDYNVRKSK